MTGKTTNVIMTKNNNNFINVLLFVFLAISLFAYEFIPNFSEKYYQAIDNHSKMKAERVIALNKLKEYTKKNNPELYKEYFEIKEKTNEAWEQYLKIKKEERFFNFRSVQLFSGEFFPNLALFILLVYILYNSYREKSKNVGIKILYFTFMSYCLFQFYWIFQPFQDVNRYIYIAMALFSSYFVGLAVYIINKQKVKRSERLKKKLLKVSYHALKNAKEEKLEEMAKVIEKPM